MKIVQPYLVTDSTLTASNVTETDNPAHSLTKVYALGDVVQVVSTNVHKVYTSLTGSRSAVTFSSASPGVVNWAGHGRALNDPVSFTTTGALPTGITANTVYYVLSPTANTFNISATPGGTAINLTGTPSGTHTATSSLNYAKDPATNPTLWLDSGSTNKWKMFDQSVQSQTVRSGGINVTLSTTGYIDKMAFLNVKASSIRVVGTHGTSGVVYDVTKNTSSTLGITDLFMYFYSPVRKSTDMLFEDIPLFANLTFTITITNIDGPAACGACVFGQSVDISSTKLGVEQGAKLGITDYSIKQTDDFGNYTIVERAFARRCDYTVYVENTDLDYVYDLFSKLRAKPTLYIGSSRFGASIVYGFYKDFSIDISYYDCSVCSVTLEGLT